MIKRYIGSDYSRLVDIWAKAVKVSSPFLSEKSYNYILSKLGEYFEKVDIYVYRREGKILAFMGVDDNKMEMLFCDPEYFRQGIGSSMLEYALQFLHIKYIDVCEENTSAVNFYTKCGFNIAGSHKHEIFGYKQLHLIYAKGV